MCRAGAHSRRAVHQPEQKDYNVQASMVPGGVMTPPYIGCGAFRRFRAGTRHSPYVTPGDS